MESKVSRDLGLTCSLNRQKLIQWRKKGDKEKTEKKEEEKERVLEREAPPSL